MTAAPEITLLTDWPSFLAVEAEWRALNERAGGALFSSFNWLVAIEAGFGLQGPLVIVTMWRDGRMVAAAPLTETRPKLSKLAKGYRPRALAPVVCKYSGFAEIIAETPQDLQALAAAIVAVAGQRVLDFGMMREGAGRDALCAACRAAGRRLRETPAFESCYVDLPGSWAGYLEGRSRNFRKTLRKAWARFDELGGQVERVTRFDAATMLRVRAISERSWKGTAGTGVAALPENSWFVFEICSALAPLGAVEVLFLTIDGQDVAFCVTLRHGKVQYGIWTEFDEAAAEVSPGRLSIARLIEGLVSNADVTRLDMLRRTHFLRDFSDDFYTIGDILAVPAFSPSALLIECEGLLRRLLRNRRFGKRTSVRRADVLPVKDGG